MGTYQPRWLIAFTTGYRPLPRPWRWFVRPRFEHVFAFHYDPNMNRYVNAEWAASRMHIEILPSEVMNATIRRIIEEDLHLLRYTPEQNPPRWSPGGPLYCVSFIKHLLGLRRCWAVTPYQLFCALKKRGAEVIVAPESED